MKRHITWVISDINKSFQFEWLISGLLSKQVDMSFILINMKDSPMDRYLKSYGKEPLHLKISSYFTYLSAIFKCINHYRFHKTQVVHCHLLKANLIGLSAAWLGRISKRIYTRHHSTYHHQFSKKGVRLDQMINWLSTTIIAISNQTKKVLVERENVPSVKVRLIPHGFDFMQMDLLALHKKVTLTTGHFPVIGVVSRFIEWKGIQYIIPAYKELLNDYPKSQLLLIGGSGPYHEKIQHLLKQIPVDSFRIIEFEENLYPLYKEMDVFVHVPIDADIEAYGQIYVEASAMGIPSVFTLSGIAHEFVRNEENALQVAYQDSEAIHQAMLRLLSNKELAERLGSQAREDVLHRFDLSSQVELLLDSYR